MLQITYILIFFKAYCSAKGCSSNRRDGKGLLYFHCPMNPEVSKKWIIKSRKPYMLNKPPRHCHNNIMFCSKHFERSMFADNTEDLLLRNAVPTLFDPSQITTEDGTYDTAEVEVKTEPTDGETGEAILGP